MCHDHTAGLTSFNLKRDASPLAKLIVEDFPLVIKRFNLKRDASPLATTTGTHLLDLSIVSISSEMPAP